MAFAPGSMKAMRFNLIVIAALFLAAGMCAAAAEKSDFRVPPYIQNPAPDAMTIVWFSELAQQGHLIYRHASGTASTIYTFPVRADALAYPRWEAVNFFSGSAPLAPYRHSVRLTGLTPDTEYSYTVEQGVSRFTSTFRTAPSRHRAVRFIVYADSETEPESTGQRADWSDPASPGVARTYPIDQTLGYANNLRVIGSRAPDFVVVAGDLVQHGGEQRDWDEFWRHITGNDGAAAIASRIPFLASPGNHEYYEGTSLGQYDQPGSERAIARYLTYFEYPSNGSSNPAVRNRYYRIDYGPVTVIALDLANGSPDGTDRDTNFYLKGELDPDGGDAPDFNPGSEQYVWLESQLKDAREKSRFTFVVFHHAPYSVGPHGWPVGVGTGFDNQSGRPVRVLDALFMKYGVDAVLSGHDEMLERSVVSGVEVASDGSESPHDVHYYDAGIGGDGLRGPEDGLANPFQAFLAHTDAPEVWNDGVLVDGGKHYGHLEIDVYEAGEGNWRATITPVYVFPLVTKDGLYTGYERRTYRDVVTLSRNDPPSEVRALAPPSDLTVSDVPGDNGHAIRLAWTASPSEADGKVAGYRVFRSRIAVTTTPVPLSRFMSLDTLIFYEERATILIDSVATGVTSYTDRSVPRNGVPYYYWVQAWGPSGASRLAGSALATAVSETGRSSPVFRLADAVPNPFNPSTAIGYTLPSRTHVTLEVFNIVGRRVALLADGVMPAGTHRAAWDARGMPSGVYVYRLRTGDGLVGTKKALLVK